MEPRSFKLGAFFETCEKYQHASPDITHYGQTLRRTAMYTADVTIIIVPMMDNAFGTEWKKTKSFIVA